VLRGQVPAMPAVWLKKKKTESGKKWIYQSHMPPSEFASFLAGFGFSVLFLS